MHQIFYQEKYSMLLYCRFRSNFCKSCVQWEGEHLAPKVHNAIVNHAAVGGTNVEHGLCLYK